MPPNKCILKREGLLQRLRQATGDYSVVLVQAPSGYGKTHLLQELTRKQKDVWHHTGVSDLPRLHKTLHELVHESYAAVPAEVDQIGGGEGRGTEAPLFVSGLAKVDEPVLLIIEDTHLFDDSDLSRFIEATTKGPKTNVCIVVLSRSVPRFASSDLIISGKMTIFGAHDLQFDDEEMAEAIDLGFDEKDVKSALNEADGWPAGFRTLLHAPHERGRLVEAMISMISDKDLSLFKNLSIFEAIDEVSASICGERVVDRIKTLEREGAMLRAAADGRTWRIHPMLRDALRERIRRDDPDIEKALHAKAARAYASSKRIATALYHLEKSGDLNTMIDLRDHAVSALIAGDVEAITKFASAARGSGFQDEALFSFISAYRKKTQGMGDTREAFRIAAETADSACDEMLAFESRIQIVENDLANGNSVDEGSLKDLIERGKKIGPVAHSSALVRAGWSAIISGDFERGLSYAMDAPTTGNIIEKTLMVPLRAYAKTAMGFFDEADADVANFLNEIQDLSPKIYGRMLVWAARLAWLRGECEGSLRIRAARAQNGQVIRTCD